MADDAHTLASRLKPLSNRRCIDSLLYSKPAALVKAIELPNAISVTIFRDEIYMQSVKIISGLAVPFGVANVDTDVIIPARYLKTISRTGLGRGAFAGYRQVIGNIFDSDRYRAAPILIAGANFGCGSSREHAAWALLDLGIQVVIAPSFADIFASNAFKNGMVLVALPQAQIERLMLVAVTDPITVDLENQVVTTPFQDRFSFEIDPFRKHCLLSGLDEIGLTEALDGDIARYEADLAAAKPWVGGAARRDISGTA